jgi:perosamine synthetase
MDLKPGDEVIVPAYTFFATVTPLFQTGAHPILADAGPDGNIDPQQVKNLIGTRTRAIVATHMWGVPADVVALRQIADKHELILLEDTSHAFGASIGGRPVGAFGHMAAQSLQGQKPLTGGEGGVFYTSEDEYFYRAISVAHYNARARQEIPSGHMLARYAVTGLGLKWRIHPIAAAIVEQQLEVYGEIHRGRTETAAYLTDALNRLDGIKVVTPAEGNTSSWYALVIIFDDEILTRKSVDEIKDMLHERGAVEIDRPGSTRPLAQLALFQRPGQVFPRYAEIQAPLPENYPVAEEFYRRTLKMPVWHTCRFRPLADAYVRAFENVLAQIRAEEPAIS